MKLSISNIAWTAEHDAQMYSFLMEQGFTGLEIAPTRLFPKNPYDYFDDAKEFAVLLKSKYGLSISSMQSIWYGVSQSIFAADEDRNILIAYTKKAIDFAEAIDCKNLVFGCPKNRVIPSDEYLPFAYDFFRTIGEYASRHNTTIAIEPNPPYYNTNFINTTSEAFEFCKKIDCDGLRVNVDLGTCMNYNESVDFLNENIQLVNHIHISEPMLVPIERRPLHNQLKTLNYDKYFSIEMKNMDDVELVKRIVRYVKGVLR